MKVLIALDDSPFSQHLLELVCRRRWAVDTEFKILHVIEPLTLSDWAGEGWAAMHHELSKKRHNYAEKLLADARHKIEKHVPGSIVHYELREGRPQVEITMAASDWNASKILMGAHSREVCPHNLIGSVSRGVAEHSPCTVEVIRHAGAAKHKKELTSASTAKRK